MAEAPRRVEVDRDLPASASAASQPVLRPGWRSTLVVAALAIGPLVPASAAAPAPTVGHPAVAAASDWTTFDHDQLRTGVDSSGSSFSPATPAWTSPTFDGQLYGQPLVFAGRVFAATENDTVYALAADSGSVLWSSHLGSPLDPATVPDLCGDIHPTVGITSTPVIDARGEVFVVATMARCRRRPHHLIGLDLYTGAVLLNEVIDPRSHPTRPSSCSGTSLAIDRRPGRHRASAGTPGTASPTTGWVVSAPEDGSAPSTFRWPHRPGTARGRCGWAARRPPSTPRATSGCPPATAPVTARLDAYDNSDSVLKLSPTMELLDGFAPTLWYQDNAVDADLGSTAPALLPNGLVFEVGKSTTAYVLHQSHLGGIGGQREPDQRLLLRRPRRRCGRPRTAPCSSPAATGSMP